MNLDRTYTCITLVCFLSVTFLIFIKSICNNCFFSCIGKNCFIIYKPNFNDAHSYCVNYIIFLLIIDIVIILHLCKNYFLFSYILCFFRYFFVVIIVVIPI